jgi:hypothetical protein
VGNSRLAEGDRRVLPDRLLVSTERSGDRGQKYRAASSGDSPEKISSLTTREQAGVMSENSIIPRLYSSVMKKWTKRFNSCR